MRSNSNQEDRQAGGRAGPKSSAIFSRSRAGDVHVRTEGLRGANMVTRACLACGVENRRPPKRVARLAPPEWFIFGAAAVWGAFLVIAAQTPDFMWYHSTKNRGFYDAIVAVAINWSIVLPFLFLGTVAAMALVFIRMPLISICTACDETQRIASRDLRVRIGVGAILVTLSSFLLVTGLKLPLALAGLFVVPFAALAIFYSRKFRSLDRLVFHPATEGVVTISGGPALRDVLQKERPQILSQKAPGRRWAAASVAAVVFGLTFSLLAHVTRDEISCPPGTRYQVDKSDLGIQKWCELPGKVWHGRYVRYANDGSLQVVGGFSEGTPSGNWIDYVSNDDGAFVDETTVEANISNYAPIFHPGDEALFGR